MSTSTRRSVAVTGDPAVVADYILDFTTSAEWDPHTVSCRRLDDGPLAVGARYENVQELMGHKTSLEYRVVEYEPGHRVVLEGGNDNVHTRDEITVSATTGGAQVDYDVTVELLGKAKLGEPLLPRAVEKIADDGEEQMRRVLAERVGAPRP